MKCPRCFCLAVAVERTRQVAEQVRRWRRCLNKQCNHQFSTTERLNIEKESTNGLKVIAPTSISAKT